MSAPDLHIEEATSRLKDVAEVNGRKPAAWMWGPDVRMAWSVWLDSEEAKMTLVYDPTLKLPDDGRICEYSGLPAYPMICDGVALRTVKRVESGFD